MQRDANATRARIFRAASDEFAEYGIAGARVDRIAEGAKANKARIYEYFGNKEQLFETVLEEELQRLILDLPLADDSDAIPENVGRAFDHHQAHPNLVRLLHWEAFHFGTSAIPGQIARRRLYADRAAKLGKGQQQGLIETEFDPRHLHFLLLSLATSWFGLPQLARMHIDGDPFAVHSTTEHRRNIVLAVQQILAASASEEPTASITTSHDVRGPTP